MPKPLIFIFGNEEIAFILSKIDRSKLYGFKEIEVLDEENRPCELATLADDGRTIVGRGGTGIGYVSPDGMWCDKSTLVPVDLDGNQITPVPSSFSEPVVLEDKATLVQYLEHNVRAIYLLESETVHSELHQELKDGAIFTFPYSYRGGLEADTGFLLMNKEREIFLAVGNPTRVEFLGLQQAGAWVEEDEGEQSEADPMDFDMI